MYVAKIVGMYVKLLEPDTGLERRSILCGKNIQAAVVQGDIVVVTCGDRKIRTYDARTGVHLQTM